MCPASKQKNMLASLPAARYGPCVIYVFANTKGGVGKSTLAVHFAVWLHDQGKSVALLDADKQRSSSQWMSEVEPQIAVGVADSPERCVSAGRELLRSHDLVVADGPAGLDDVSRTMLILADFAILPVTPSILDVRSVQQATTVLDYARGINDGRPAARLVLNKIRRRDTISRELQAAAPRLGLRCAKHVVRDLQAYRDAAQQGSVVARMGRKTAHAAREIDDLFGELMRIRVARSGAKKQKGRVANG